MLQGVAGVAVQYLGYTPGLFIVGLFAILILWMYANFWITGTLLIVGGMVFFLLLALHLHSPKNLNKRGKHFFCNVYTAINLFILKEVSFSSVYDPYQLSYFL